jgi:DNA-directed RNA polymerase subunit RPC12/RpoP
MSDIKFNCPQCGQHLTVDATGAGMTVACPKCGQAIIVPHLARLAKLETPKRTKLWLWSSASGIAAVALVVVWFLIIRQPEPVKRGQETNAASPTASRAISQGAASISQSQESGAKSAPVYKKIVTFQTKEPAPRQFDAWEFVWSMGNVESNTELDYVVLQPDGKEYYRSDLTMALRNRSTRGVFTVKSDFGKGFPPGSGDPGVFFNKHIQFMFRASDGDFSFSPESKSVFHFFKKDEQGKVNWNVAVASIDAVIPSENSPGGIVSADDLKRGLVLYFDFDKAPVAGKVPDLSGQGNDGEAVNVQWVADGHRSGSIVFGLTNSYITVPNNDNLNPRCLTVAAWIKTSYSDNVWRRIFDKCYSKGFALSEGGDYQQIHNKGKLEWETGVVYGGQSQQSIADGQWHHVVGTYDGTGATVYLDGLPVGKPGHKVGELPHTPYDLTIGANRSNPDAALGEVGASFNGMMDDVMMFNRALSAEEIQALFKSQGGTLGAQSTQPAPAASPQNKPSAADRLRQVKQLFDQGLINKEDYDKKVKEIMDSL